MGRWLTLRQILYWLSAALIIFVLPVRGDAACTYDAGKLVRCLAADAKPSVVDDYVLIETDTGKLFRRKSAAWHEITDHSVLSSKGTYTHGEIDSHLTSSAGHVWGTYLAKADAERWSSGLLSGGALTATGGNTFAISAGAGYINDPTSSIGQRISWDEITGVQTVGDGTNYVTLDSDGNPVVSPGHTEFASTNASTLTSGTLDGDRLPGLSAAKRGGVPATGTPSGLYLRDDGTWAAAAGGGYATIQEEGSPLTQRTILNFSGTSITCADDTTRTTCTLTAGGAPVDGEYTTYAANTTLTAERVWNNGTNTTIDIATAGQIKINVPDASTTVKGAVELATDGEGTAALAVQANDGRLSNARTPTNHDDTFHTASYSGVGTCTNQFARILNDNAAPTCAGIGVADFTANQGTTTQVLHGNAAGQPSWTAITGDDLPTITVAKGGSGLTTVAANQVYVGSAADTFTTSTIEDCSNATTSKVLFNGTTHDFYCGTDQTSGGGPISAKLTADYTNSTTTGTEVTGLQVTLAAGTYRFSYFLAVQAATAANAADFGINFTGTHTVLMARLNYSDTGSTATAGSSDDVVTGDGGELLLGSCVNTAESTTVPNLNCVTSMTTANANNFWIIEGVIVVTVSGDFELWAASESTTAIRVMTGSNLLVTSF